MIGPLYYEHNSFCFVEISGGLATEGFFDHWDIQYVTNSSYRSMYKYEN